MNHRFKKPTVEVILGSCDKVFLPSNNLLDTFAAVCDHYYTSLGPIIYSAVIKSFAIEYIEWSPHPFFNQHFVSSLKESISQYPSCDLDSTAAKFLVRSVDFHAALLFHVRTPSGNDIKSLDLHMLLSKLFLAQRWFSNHRICSI